MLSVQVRQATQQLHNPHNAQQSPMSLHQPSSLFACGKIASTPKCAYGASDVTDDTLGHAHPANLGQQIRQRAAVCVLQHQIERTILHMRSPPTEQTRERQSENRCENNSRKAPPSNTRKQR